MNTNLVVIGIVIIEARAAAFAKVLLASIHDYVINFQHCHKLGLLFEKLVEQGTVASSQNENLFSFKILFSPLHEGFSVNEITVGKVYQHKILVPSK